MDVNFVIKETEAQRFDALLRAPQLCVWQKQESDMWGCLISTSLCYANDEQMENPPTKLRESIKKLLGG